MHVTQRSLKRPGGDTAAATGNYACSAACRRLSRLARPRLSSRADEHRKVTKTIGMTCSHLNMLVSDIVLANAVLRVPLRQDNRGALRLDLWHRCKSPPFLGTKGASAASGWRGLCNVEKYGMVPVKIRYPSYTPFLMEMIA